MKKMIMIKMLMMRIIIMSATLRFSMLIPGPKMERSPMIMTLERIKITFKGFRMIQGLNKTIRCNG